MDEHTRCRLLSSVYQPRFVNIALALLHESENLLIQINSGYSDQPNWLLQAIELLQRLSTDVKVSLNGDEFWNSGWPLCTDRYLVCHLGDPLAPAGSPSPEHRSVGGYKVGDFYYSIIPVDRATDKTEIAFRLALYHLDSSEGDFREITFHWDDFLTLLRNFGQSATVNDRRIESKGQHRSAGFSFVGADKKKRLFRRCMVRDGKNLDLELVTWKQLRRSQSGCISNCHMSNNPTTPVLNFIDNHSPPMSQKDSTAGQREQLEIERTREDVDTAKAVLSPLLSSSSCSTNRIPKRIAEVCSEFFSRGCISFTGGRYRQDERYALVEIRLDDGQDILNEQTTAEFANALLYLYWIHKRCLTTAITADSTGSHKCGLVFVVSLERKVEQKRVQDSSLLRCFKKVLDTYMQRLPKSVEKIVFVDVSAEEIAKLVAAMDEQGLEGEIEAQTLTLSQTELHEQVGDVSEFSESLGGTVMYDRKRWVAFRQDLEKFMDACRTVGKVCVSSTQTSKETYSDSKMTSFWMLKSGELDEELCQLKRHQAKLDENPCTVQLTENGDQDLRALRETYDDLKHLRSYRDATEKVGLLYTEVRKVMVKVQNGTDRRVTMLETYLKTKTFLEQCQNLVQVLSEIENAMGAYSGDVEGARRAKELVQKLDTYNKETVGRKLEEANAALQMMPTQDELDILTQNQKETVMDAVDELERLVATVPDSSQSNLNRLRTLVSCHDFLDQAYDWALDGHKMLNSLASSTSTFSKQANDELHVVTSHLDSHPPISPKYFDEKIQSATEAGDEKLVIQIKTVQERCVNTERALMNWVKLLEHAADGENVDASGSVVSSETAGSSPPLYGNVDIREERPVQRCRPCSTMSASLCVLSTPQGMLEGVTVDLDNIEWASASEKVDFTGIITEDLTDNVVSEISANTLRKKRVERLTANVGNVGNGGRKGSLPAPPPSADLLMTSEKTKSRRPFRKLMKRSNTVDDVVLNSKPTRHQSLESLASISEESADIGAMTSKSVPFGDMVPNEDNASAAAGDEEEVESSLDIPPPFVAPFPPSNVPLINYGRYIPSPLPDCSPNVRMQHMVSNELLLTEEAYVVSLQYVIENYLPEMHRTDLPHQLLGQRVTIFGNIEKIFEFHCGQFLPELKRNCCEASDALGAQVAKCFLKFRSQFHLYALYNKNKPKSDALMTECASAFFKTKQLLLRDKLDLSSYLLKPVQRMGKYALMLQQLIKACPTYDQEQLDALKKAEELVTFQLRHGNDLLAMDSIQHCNMNLKEQGQLLRQDEFIVNEGRVSQKRVRRVFLFEQLVLFTKPKRIRQSSGAEREVYEAKRCIKMNDVGMTEQVGDSDLKFELWFLRHTSGQRFVLQAPSASVRLAWIDYIRRILWKQVFSNRDLRKAELSSMGGNLCMDLKPSEGRIEDRALNASLLMKISQPTLPSVCVSYPSPCNDYSGCQGKRPHSLISVSSSTSSSNFSSSTDSSGFRPQRLSIRDANNLRTSSESGICLDFNRSETRSSLTTEVDEGLSKCDLSEPTSITRDESKSENQQGEYGTA